MNYSLRATPQGLRHFSKNWGWFMAWGIALIIIGLLALSATTLTTMISVSLLGLVIALSGIVIIVDSFTAWRQTKPGFFLHLLMGILYLLVGFYLIQDPLLSSTYLTLVLGILYLFLGIFRLFYSLSLQPLTWGWNFFNGLLTAFLGILILASWPTSSLYIIGLFVAIDLLVCGWVYLMAAFAARSFSK